MLRYILNKFDNLIDISIVVNYRRDGYLKDMLIAVGADTLSLYYTNLPIFKCLKRRSLLPADPFSQYAGRLFKHPVRQTQPLADLFVQP